MNHNMLPTATAIVVKTNGRTYTPVQGVPQVVPDFDAAILSANGWVNSAGNASSGSDTTVNRPANPKRNDTFHDQTLGIIIIFDGKVWRNPVTGALV